MGEHGGGFSEPASRSDVVMPGTDSLWAWRLDTYDEALRALSKRTRLPIEASSARLETSHADAIRERHRGSACFVHLRHRDQSTALVEVPAAFALLLIDRALGAKNIRPAVPRPLRAVECGIFTHLAAEFSRSVQAHGWRVMDVHSDRSSAACEWMTGHPLMQWVVQISAQGSFFDLRVWFDPARMPAGDPLQLILSGADAGLVEIPCRVEVGHAWIDAPNLGRLQPGGGIPLTIGPRPAARPYWSGDLHLSPLTAPTLLWCLRATPIGWRLLSALPLQASPPAGVKKTRLSVFYRHWKLSSEALRDPASPLELRLPHELSPIVRVATPCGRAGDGELVSLGGLPWLRWTGWD